jgi:hypothetical protein
MRCWSSADGFRALVSTALALVLAGCGAGEGTLAITGVRTPPFELPELDLQLDLPVAVRDGLERGVALSFRLDLQLGDARQPTQWRELRYLPLIRQYQLREPGSDYSRGYSSRAAALAALERWPLPAQAADSDLTARVRLDSTRLPAPLVLPAVFDSDWRLDSGTTRWPSARR